MKRIKIVHYGIVKRGEIYGYYATGRKCRGVPGVISANGCCNFLVKLLKEAQKHIKSDAYLSWKEESWSLSSCNIFRDTLGSIAKDRGSQPLDMRDISIEDVIFIMNLDDSIVSIRGRCNYVGLLGVGLRAFNVDMVTISFSEIVEKCFESERGSGGSCSLIIKESACIRSRKRARDFEEEYAINHARITAECSVYDEEYDRLFHGYEKRAAKRRKLNE